MDKDLARFEVLLKEIQTLSSVKALLGWDEQAKMPAKGAQARGEQHALLSSLIHERVAGDEMGDLLARAQAMRQDGKLSPEAEVNIRETQRRYDRETRLSKTLVEEIATTQSAAQAAWRTAKQESKFSKFAEVLEKMLSLKRQAAESYGYEHDVYDALLDEFEPGMTCGKLEPCFLELRNQIVPLLQSVLERQPPKVAALYQHTYAPEKQEALARKLAQAIGFDFEAGRLDTSPHPFCEGIATGDVRMTTRYNEHDPFGSIYGVLHEAGHGLYEQGLDPRYAGTPMGQSVSLGIHESQSRFLENMIGRSREFWEFAIPLFQDSFDVPTDLATVENVYNCVNRVEPGPIRFGADEVTYNLHILVRFELERDLLNGRLAVRDLPEAWNSKLEMYLGVTPKNDAEGVLQDIHWAYGYFGYFPTYTLGNLYAAQFCEALDQAVPDMRDQVRRGEFQNVLEWLRTHIHRQGMRYRASELVESVTGRSLSGDAFIRYLHTKYLT